MIYVMLANGFEEIEAITVIDILRRAELDVKTVGVSDNFITGAHSVPVVADEIDVTLGIPSDLEMIVLPGGMPGTLNLEKSKCVNALIDYALQNDKYIAAICAAPSILGHKNILNGKTACCYEGFEQELLGANISYKNVCVDGKIVTSRGAGTAMEFALELAGIMTSVEEKNSIRASLL